MKELTHVETAALGCPVERSSTGFGLPYLHVTPLDSRGRLSLREFGPARVPAPHEHGLEFTTDYGDS
jgi:hypothetical protein